MSANRKVRYVLFFIVVKRDDENVTGVLRCSAPGKVYCNDSALLTRTQSHAPNMFQTRHCLIMRIVANKEEEV